MATRPEIERIQLSVIPGQPEVLSLPASGPVIVPGGGLMTDAVFARVDGDLLIELSDGARLIVRDYFTTAHPPPLASDAGAHIAPDVVSALAGVDAAATPTVTAGAAPIGRIETVSGDAEIVHADGTRTEAEAGTLLARGDRIETGADANAGMLFADESTFSVGSHAKATFDDLIYDPDSGAQHATFIVQQGTFSFSGGGIAMEDGAFVIKTPAATISVDGASGAGRVETDGGTMVTYLRADDVGAGAIRVENPGGAEVLDHSYEGLIVDDYFSRPSGVLRLGPRDTAEHYGDAITALPDAHAIMPDTLLAVKRGADPASQAVAREAEEADFAADEADGSANGLEDALQVDRDTAFEIAARKAAIAAAARDAASEALSDASEAEKAARTQAAEASTQANEKLSEAEQLRQQALDVLAESERRDQAFEQAIRDADTASAAEDNAARAVAETDLAEAQAAERLASAEEAVRRALEAAEQARNEALQILEEAKQKEAAFAEAQRAAAAAKEAEEARALAVAEADAAEEAAAAALKAAEAAAQSAARDAEAAERVAQEASTAAEVVETVVERELAAIDPDLLKPPAADDPSSSRGDWITQTNASMNVARAAMDAGEAAAREAYRAALREGSSIEEALERAIIAAEAYGGAKSADQVIAAGPDGLIEPGEDTGDIVIAGGGGFVGDAGTTGAIGTDVLIGGAGADALGAAGGGGYGGIDGLFGFGFRFTPIVLNLSSMLEDDDDERDDPVVLTATTTAQNVLQGTALADFLVGNATASTIGAQEGADFVYGDTPTNLLSGTHNISNTLTNPTFDASGGDDLLSGGAGDDSLWGGAGADTIYGDVPDDTGAFGISLGSAGNGADDIYGGDGNDTIYGNGGADTLNGEGGDDTFMLGDDDAANDVVRGGDSGADSGTDTVDYSGAGAAVTVDLAAGTAAGANTGNDTLSGIENVVGSGFDDTLSGSAVDNTLSGGGGADTLSGLGGADNIFGYAGDDVLIGGEGVDRLSGGTGADQFRFEGGTGADALAKAASLGTDIISDYNASENDLFMLSDGDFSLGNAGTLTDNVNYFEADTTSISSIAQNLSGGVANAGVVIIGSASGADGAEVWYTDNAAAMTDSNSYQIANVTGADRSTIDAGDFNLKS
ncbi:FecR domain-containing protein [Thalassospiraceae bacterium LMO-JJ14]|nr:FecR domain-containing protein [Thalassospiraceae bacterium LMO-JJ14]